MSWADYFNRLVRHKQEKRNKMINLLLENTEKANAQIAHLIFCRYAKMPTKKNKRVFYLINEIVNNYISNSYWN
jgi:hypothetical protein